MEREKYIQLFDKFLKKEATLDKEWNAVSSEMNPELQQKLLGQIKSKIGLSKKLH